MENRFQDERPFLAATLTFFVGLALLWLSTEVVEVVERGTFMEVSTLIIVGIVVAVVGIVVVSLLLRGILLRLEKIDRLIRMLGEASDQLDKRARDATSILEKIEKPLEMIRFGVADIEKSLSSNANATLKALEKIDDRVSSIEFDFRMRS